MNTLLHPPHRRTCTGSILLTVLIFLGALVVVGGAVFAVITQEYTLSKRSIAWNQALYAAEAGVEVGWNEINRLTLSLNPGGTFMSGWTQLSAWYWQLNSQTLAPLSGMESSSSYSVYVATNYPIPRNHTIWAVGTASAPRSPAVSRQVKVQCAPHYPFEWGILARGMIDFNGNSAYIDSYISDATNRGFNVAYRRAHGDIGTNGQLIDAAGLDIWGTAMTGPGGVVTTAPGFRQYQPVSPDSGTNAISDGLRVPLPDAALPWTPSAAIVPPLVGGVRTLTAPIHDQVTIGTIDNDLCITGSGLIRIYVQGEIDLGGSDDIMIVPNPSNATVRVEFYVRDRVNLGGNGIINPTQRPGDMLIYGLPTCSSVEVSGTADFRGAIYAPGADTTLNGGALFEGAVVCRTLRAVGTLDFHYDESLRTVGRPIYFSIVWWKEYWY